MKDYRSYPLQLWEWAGVLAIGGIAAISAGLLFFDAWLAAFLFLPALWLMPRWYSNWRQRQIQDSLASQFQQMLDVMATALSAGRSVESALQETYNDLQLLYRNPQTPIVREVKVMVGRLAVGDTAERVLRDFATRTGIEEIREFAEVFGICKRSGGNLIEVARRAAYAISERIRVSQEIQVLIAQKKLEARMLALAPIVFVGLLRAASPDYMAPLYSGIGWMVMAGALALIALAVVLMIRITRIHM
ncbi:type II secretion system F family protein [Xylanibacillus composti]|uniref:Type II secretion system F family protein n=1 Tax=Xylanibacillus composti TaxID=1572762 RepID=A0A8J4GZT4_9BACL|nr:type II secretion system F family protein [Xylanibacillus composti]GIQ68252.1 type II secretion system F family protein [Xylanibacillus composti]